MNRIISEELYNDLCQVLDMSSWTDELEALRSAPLATALDLSKVQRYWFSGGVRYRKEGGIAYANLLGKDGTYDNVTEEYVKFSDLATLQPPNGQVGEVDRLDDALAMWVKGQIDDNRFQTIVEEVVNALRQPVETVSPATQVMREMRDRIPDPAIRTQPQAPKGNES